MKLTNTPNPAQSYDDALARIEQLRALDTDDIQPECHLRFFSHGNQVEKAVILAHGYTASPYQFHQLGQTLFELGYNVLIPRMPHHGHKNRLSENHADLTAQEMIDALYQAIDIGQGLGQQVDVMGFSMGGVLTAWAAQNRADIHRAVIISPAMSFHAIPYFLTRLVMWFTDATPNRFRWWNPDLQDQLPYPPYDYPRFATRALAQLLKLGFAVRRQAAQSLPAAQSIVMVTNANDEAVNNRAALDLVRRWRKQGATNIRTCEFTPEQALQHDFIDPAKKPHGLALTYPILVDLLTN